MQGLGALQRHQLPHPLAKILDPPLFLSVIGLRVKPSACANIFSSFRRYDMS